MLFTKYSNFEGVNKDIVNMVNDISKLALAKECEDPKTVVKWVKNNYQKVLMIAAKNGVEWFKITKMSEEEHEFITTLRWAAMGGEYMLSSEQLNKYYETYGPNLAFTSFLLSNMDNYGQTKTILALLALHYNSKQFAKDPELMVNWIGLPVAAQVYELLELMTFGYDRDTVARIKKAIEKKQEQYLYLNM